MLKHTARRVAAALMLAAGTCAARAALPEKPRLVVLISIDQFRGDYLTRFPNLFLPDQSKDGVGGFRYLMERGAFYPNAQYAHFPLVTGVGHAVLSTGGTPNTNGIVGNDWYVPAANGVPGHPLYCVEDPDAPIVGSAALKKGMSPKNLRSTTIGDELKMATGGRAKVFTVSFKDRAAILLAGRLSDATVWFDENTGRWVSSRFYCPNGQLPAWVASENAKAQADFYFGQTWSPLLPNEVANNTWMPAPNAVSPGATIGSAFPHRFNGGLSAPGKAFYHDLWTSPFATQMVLQTAADGVVALGMGQDDVPDYLGINLAANDYVGHAFGPTSPEAFDITLRTDRLLADFFRTLDKNVPGGLKNVVIAVSADHGVAPIPEEMLATGFRAGRITEDALSGAADRALDERFGADDWVSATIEPAMWLNPEAMKRHNADPREARRVAADAVRAVEGVYDVATRDQCMDGGLADTPIMKKVVAGFYPKVSGDLLIIPENLWFQGSGHAGTNHETPWAYDTHVPIIIAGMGIRPGRYPRVATPQEIAPTLAALCGVDPPSACTASPLAEALQ